MGARGRCARNILALYERYELLELRRDDGIQTFHARDIETARPVQFHLVAKDESGENVALLARLEYLPEAERRRVIERGEYQGMPYVITDRLAGYPGFREWLMVKTEAPERNSKLDEQFHQLFDAPAAQNAQPVSAAPVWLAPSELDRQFLDLFEQPAREDAPTVVLAMKGPVAEGAASAAAGWSTRPTEGPTLLSTSGSKTMPAAVSTTPSRIGSTAGSETGSAGFESGLEREGAAVSANEEDSEIEAPGEPEPRGIFSLAAKSLFAVVLGIIAAIVILGLLVAAVAFRRR
jgi:hypothetical protein